MSVVPAERKAATVLAMMASVGCGQPTPPQLPEDGWGPSHGIERLDPVAQRPAVPRPKAIPTKDRKRWSRADELDSLQPIAGRGRSEHVDGELERTVAVNDAAAGYAHLVPGGSVPTGALVVQRHHHPGSDTLLFSYVMSKDQAGWHFIVLDAHNRVASHQSLQLCARCHGDAPSDSLFGPALGRPSTQP